MLRFKMATFQPNNGQFERCIPQLGQLCLVSVTALALHSPLQHALGDSNIHIYYSLLTKAQYPINYSTANETKN